MAEANLWDRIVRCFRLYAAPLRFSLRFALAASLAYAAAGLLNFPLHGLWAVLTAVMVKPGAVVIDVGMNRNDEGKLCGDVDFDGCKEIAGFITPVPGGVGPMTITMLLVNTMEAAERVAAAAA